jgi:hypothetical protein
MGRCAQLDHQERKADQQAGHLHQLAARETRAHRDRRKRGDDAAGGAEQQRQLVEAQRRIQPHELAHALVFVARVAALEHGAVLAVHRQAPQHMRVADQRLRRDLGRDAQRRQARYLQWLGTRLSGHHRLLLESSASRDRPARQLPRHVARDRADCS